ncbi:lipocalin-like domain-containing protein [Bradyrhizobium sp. STM 3566]|uniref:lipocalin-like domain-containing protein n=1 Tax=Bradyrhizobium sp. STM 3566 TaxID=578928 RepID=UPI00388DF2E9
MVGTRLAIHGEQHGALVALLIAFCCYFPSGPVFADDTSKQLVGSWKLTSWTIQIVGGDATEPFGPNPKARALFTPDGFAAFMIVGANRKPATNDEEAAVLLRSLLVYTGKFTIDGDKFTTKVDISGNELLTGLDQVRFFKLEGNRMSLRTAEQVSSVGTYQGKKVVGTLTWEREP